MDEYDALVTSERIKNIFVEYLFSKDKLNTFYKCNKAHAGQGLVAYTWTILAIAVMVPPNLCKNQDIVFPDSKETACILFTIKYLTVLSAKDALHKF